MLALAAVATVTPCQSVAQVRHVAILEHGSQAARAGSWRIFEARLTELGYAEGGNLRIARRWADGADARVQPLALELLAGKPDVFIVNTTPATKTVMRLTDSVPIVFPRGWALTPTKAWTLTAGPSSKLALNLVAMPT